MSTIRAVQIRIAPEGWRVFQGGQLRATIREQAGRFVLIDERTQRPIATSRTWARTSTYARTRYKPA